MKVLFCQNVTRKMLPKRLSYKKRDRKTLMKSTAVGQNIIFLVLGRIPGIASDHELMNLVEGHCYKINSVLLSLYQFQIP